MDIDEGTEDTGSRRSPDVSFQFDSDPAAPRAARRALEPLFRDDGPLAENVGLVASEFVSNVILHTDAGGHMRAWDADPLRIEVHDHDPNLPAPVAPSADDGRGLHIVEDVADNWGAAPEANGKTVWAEFHRADPNDVSP